MRQDQYGLLQQRAEELTDLFLKESDPATWPGHGIEQASMGKDTRGDRYWSKKNAFATMALVQRIVGVIDTVRRKTAGGEDAPEAVTDTDDDLERESAAAEKEAQMLLKKAKSRANQTAPHGKA